MFAVSYLSIGAGYTYSLGERAGVLQTLSNRDWACETYEGLLSMSGNAVGATLWKFSVADKHVAGQIEALRSDVLSTVQAHLHDLEHSVKAHQRLAAQLGGEKVLEDLQDLIFIVGNIDQLGPFMTDLPAALSSPDWQDGSKALRIIDQFVKSKPEMASLAAALVLHRSLTPVALPGFAARLAGSDEAT